LANDLIINVWNTYSTWYMNQAINMTDYDSGLVVLVGQIVDAFAQPIIGYSSDVCDSRFGKRMPWYLFGHLCAIPSFYMIFNPPEMAIGPDDANPVPWVMYFLVVPSIMNIG
jgi:GPH family glycoside/pentoside/hexuronide:cation symporter